jgi:hypothetical protein
LIALRRWQLSHRGAPRDLASIVKSAGLESVPIDPYEGKPTRLTTCDGQPVIYSVGRDGQDDGGQKDSKLDDHPGDLLTKRMPMEQLRRIRPI